MSRIVLRRFAPLLSLAIFAVALWLLDRELKTVHYHQIMQALESLPLRSVLLAFGFTFVSYALLTGYDLLALRYLGRQLAYHRIALASFTSAAFSHTIGIIVGAPVRFRMYTAWGLSTGELARLIIFGYATFWLGYFTVTSSALLADRDVLAAHFTAHPNLLTAIGSVMAAAVAAYLILSAVRRRAFRVRQWEFKLPVLPLAVAQVVIGALDWIASGAALYVLLPSVELTFPAFLAIFMVAHIAGIISQVPGGLGVFESVMLIALTPAAPAPAILASLLLFRVVYYLLPLSAGAILVGLNELLRYRHIVTRAARVFGQWFTTIIPHALALTSFVGGMILLFSSATPSVHSRMALLDRFLPLPVVELSHFFASVVGAALLFVARGLQRRLDAAYFLTAGLLSFGIVFCLLKGLDYEEAVILSLMLLALLPCRRAFYRHSYLLREPLSTGWVFAVALVFITSIWLVFFSYKHVGYSHDLWWQFTLHGDAPRSLRATLGAATVLMLFGLSRLVRPSSPAPAAPTPGELELAALISRDTARTYGYLALLGDKSLLFSESKKSFIMYGVEGRSWVAMGDPVGDESESESLVWQFRDLCERQSGWPVFYQVEPRNLPLYIDLGLTLIKLGEEARVYLPDFSLEGRANKNLRHTHHRAVEAGCTFEMVPVPDVPGHLAEMNTVSDAWLAAKNTREKGFSLGRFDENYLRHFPAALVRVNGRVLGFANILDSATRDELSVDLMRHGELENASIIDYMFIELMLWGKAQGYRWFNLGMAPLAGLGERALAPLWSKAGAFVFRHGENFYNFKGLYNYKNKFKPVWEPRYLASPGGFALPIIAANLATLISGGIRGVVTK